MRINVLLLIKLVACADPKAAPDRASAGPPVELAAEVAALREENAELRERVKELQTASAEAADCGDLVARVAELEEDAVECTEELQRYAGEVRRYQEGAEACVAELNRLGVRGYVAPAPPPVLRVVRTLGTPRVQLAGETVIVSARLWNPAEVDLEVTVEVALLVNGSVRDSATQTLLVPAGGDHAVSETFRWGGSGGTLSGRVRVVR